jgi:hypothetical protein
MFDQTGLGYPPDQMPMTSYTGSNVLSGFAANPSGLGMGSGFGQRFMPPTMQAPMQPPVPQMQPPGMPQGMPPGMMPPQGAPPALGAYGQGGPLTFGAQGLPQRFNDFRQDLQNWRGMRPDRPAWGRPQFSGWR